MPTNLLRPFRRRAPSTHAIGPKKATNYFNGNNVIKVKEKLLKIHELFRETWPSTNNRNNEEMRTIKNTTNVENLRKLVAKELSGPGLFGKNINFAGRRMSTDKILSLLNKKIELREQRVKAYQEFQNFQRQKLTNMLLNEKTNSFQKLTKLKVDPQTRKQILFFNIARRINNTTGLGNRVFEFSIPNTENQNVVLDKFQNYINYNLRKNRSIFKLTFGKQVENVFHDIYGNNVPFPIKTSNASSNFLKEKYDRKYRIKKGTTK